VQSILVRQVSEIGCSIQRGGVLHSIEMMDGLHARNVVEAGYCVVVVPEENQPIGVRCRTVYTRLLGRWEN